MDEEKKPTEPAKVDFKTKETVENQLESFINPTEKPKPGVEAVSYYSGEGIKTEPLIKIKEGPIAETAPVEPQKMTRPIIRTYKSDVEETVQTSHISSLNIALAENRRMMGQARKTEVEEKKSGLNRNILIISLVLLIGGALTFFVPQILIQLQYGQKKAPVETVSSEPLITTELQEKINLADINTSRFATTLKERVDQSSTQLGQMKNIYITEGTGKDEKLITASRFLKLIGANPPDGIQRTLKDSYMFGQYNYNGNQRFLILKVGEYDTAFSAMLQWETSLWQDFKELFELPSDNNASSTNSFSIEIRKFQDATYNNKDARVVKDSSGNVVFLYSIVDANTIVITTSTDTLRELINRISKARVVTQ